MIESVAKSITGLDELRVYPTLPPDLSADDLERRTAASGYVTAMRYWPMGEEAAAPVWGVRVNIHFPYPMTRKESEQVGVAVARCWEWIDRQ